MREILFYETAAGNIPAAEYIGSLDAGTQAKVARALDLLAEYGPVMGPPHVKHLGGGLFELRVLFGGQAHRLLLDALDAELEIRLQPRRG
ncbi:MAG: type II toxin-antitoxin system RelE/ParE family toxin [Bacillota bacterium]